MTTSSTLLSLQDVSQDYTQGDDVVHALKPTTLDIQAGEMVGILGPSGSGKSTLLTIMGGLRTPTTGSVIIAGQDIAQMKEKRRAAVRLERLGFVLQAAGLVPFLSLRDQFVLTDKVTSRSADTATRDHLLEELGITKRIDAYPEQMSGGERQRAAIAVALYHNPDIILADEPTAALDSARATDVARLLSQLTHEQKKATVMVTHDERLLPVCDRIFRMEDGVLSPADEHGHALS